MNTRIARFSIKGIRDFALLYVGVLMADSIGLIGHPCLWTLGNPYSIPGLEPVGDNNL